MSSKLDVFFAAHPVFTVAELDAFISRDRTVNTGTRQALLSHHQRQGHVKRVRRGVYASVPIGSDAATFPVDPLLLASRLANDAVIAYHTALAFYGRAYSVRSEYTVVSSQRHVVPLSFQGNFYQAVSPPISLTRAGLLDLGVTSEERSGLQLRVTTLERTLVDTLDRPDLAGGWEEIWRSFEDVAFLKVDQVVDYSLLLGSAVVAAKTGYFLEQHADILGVTDDQLQQLRHHRPRQPQYIMQDRKDARFVSGWNLMVPGAVAGMTWLEAE